MLLVSSFNNQVKLKVHTMRFNRRQRVVRSNKYSHESAISKITGSNPRCVYTSFNWRNYLLFFDQVLTPTVRALWRTKSRLKHIGKTKGKKIFEPKSSRFQIQLYTNSFGHTFVKTLYIVRTYRLYVECVIL